MPPAVTGTYRDVDALAVALYGCDSLPAGPLSAAEIDALADRGAAALGGWENVAEHADRIDRLSRAAILGLVDAKDVETIVGSVFGDTDRMDHCYGIALGDPNP